VLAEQNERPHDRGQGAAQTRAFANIEADLRALKWMKGTILGSVVALVVKARDADGQR
jgi:hypothetical protein